MGEVFFQTSLVAAFIAGMVALFAPCCITFLLPAYLGNVFREREKVLFMTLIFGLGIFVTLLPAVIGVTIVSRLLFRYHELVYLIGGVVMLGAAVISFFGLKLPMPQLPWSSKAPKADVVSIFGLGIVSGITSACCAPVLVGVMAMSLLAPNFYGALGIGGVYVLGMITPLLLISLFLNNRIPKVELFRKPLTVIRLGGKEYPLLLGNLAASLVFFVTGVMALYLNFTGKLSGVGMDSFSDKIKQVGTWVDNLVGGNVWANILFLAFVVIFVYTLKKKL
ncbi:MAG: cytochrome c biogenesis protein CcdA [Patescibacteria group bacterium]